jgi:flagellar basal-body rod modification protein FlgD
MSAVNSIGAFAAQTAAAAAAGSGAPVAGAASSNPLQLSQSDFLQLLVTQMQNENPTQPTNPSQFINEISALSEVSDMDGMSTSMSNLASSMSSNQLLGGTSLIGQTVLASGNSAALASGGSITGAVTAPAGATALTVQVTNASGEPVDSFAVSPQNGLTPFTWNGATASGGTAPAGTYTFSVTADTNGTQRSLTPQLAYAVNSVTLDPSSNSLTLNTNGGAIPLSSVSQVF